MHSALRRPLVAGVVACSCLLARPARADEPSSSSSAVQIDTDEPGLEVLERTISAPAPMETFRYGIVMSSHYVFAPLCEAAPCTTELANGRHVLALSKPGGGLAGADAPVTISGPSSIRGTYVDRSGWRIAGGLTFLASSIAGGVLIAAGLHDHWETSCSPGSPATPGQIIVGHASDGTEVDGTTAGSPAVPPSCMSFPEHDPAMAQVGLGVLLAGGFAGLAMMLQHDAATFQVTPLALGSAPGAREGALASAMPNGLALTMTF